MDCKTARLLKIIDKRFPGCFACITVDVLKKRSGEFEIEYIFYMDTHNRMERHVFTSFKKLEMFVHNLTDTLPDVLTVNDVLNEGGSELVVE